MKTGRPPVAKPKNRPVVVLSNKSRKVLMKFRKDTGLPMSRIVDAAVSRLPEMEVEEIFRRAL